MLFESKWILLIDVKGFIWLDSPNDLNFKLNYLGKVQQMSRIKSNLTNIFLCLTKVAWLFFSNPFSNFQKRKRRTFSVSAGNRSHILTPKFKILSIPYCVICIFLLGKWSPTSNRCFASLKNKNFFQDFERMIIPYFTYLVETYLRFFIWIHVDLSRFNKVSELIFFNLGKLFLKLVRVAC